MATVTHTGLTDEGKIYDILREEGYFNLFTWRDSAGTRYGIHTHPHHEVRWVLSGRLVIVEEGVELELGPGDRMESEANTPHSAYVPEEVVYVCGSRA
ncbi:cupin domain-containing protein [Hydrogenimonas sp.]